MGAERSLAPLAAMLCVMCACAAPPERQSLTTLDDLVQVPERALASRDSRRDGVVVGLHFREPGAQYDGFLWEAANAGADSVSLVWSWQQESIHTSEVVRREEETPSDDEILRAAAVARGFGLEVTMLPFIRLDEIRRGEWRGTLAPSDRDAWWASYERFILHNAALAEEAGAAWFVVGSELGSMEVDEDRWRELIQKVREVTSARLTYSANWDHVQRTPFWSDLDAIGLTGYFELAEEGDAVDSRSLSLAWEDVVRGIDAIADAQGKPLILTEVGYTSQADAAVHPWDYTLGREVDLVGQRQLYEALARAWSDSDAVHAVFLWNWFGVGGGRNGEYTPRGKPAEHVVRTWYQGVRPTREAP